MIWPVKFQIRLCKDLEAFTSIKKRSQIPERQRQAKNIVYSRKKIQPHKTLICNFCKILHTFKQVLSSVSLFPLCFGVEASPDLSSMRNKEGCVTNINNGIEICRQEKRYSMQDVIQLKHRVITSTLRRDAVNNLNMKRNRSKWTCFALYSLRFGNLARDVQTKTRAD